MFDELSARFEDAVKGLRGQDSISETNVDGALKDVRRALLEADVSLPVVKASAKAWCRAAPSGASAEGSESETVLLLLVPAGVEGTTHTI